MKKFNAFRIFIADKIHPAGISILRKEGFNLVECFNMPNKRLLELISKRNAAGKDANSCLVVRSMRNIYRDDIDVLKACGIGLICTASSGFDNIDTKYCSKMGIKTLNVPLGNYVSAAEHTIAMILSILKNLNRADKDVRSGIFDEKKYVNYELLGMKIGVIGVGRVGSRVARLSRAFGATVFGNDIKKTLRHRYKWITFKKLSDLLKGSDIVSVHTPLDETTFNLLDAGKLHLLKKHAILINCARGGIVDEKELIKMLQQNKLYYAGVDVFENEPFVNRALSSLSNVILTPHMAGKTVESRKRISLQLAQRILDIYKRKL